MRQAALGTLISHIRQLAAREPSTVQTDAELLYRYSMDRDGTAFASLMERHGGMVWRVCRHVLHHDQDAEDAFQATFAVLARKAGSIVRRGSVASWLYGVAYRVAARASRDAALRRAREREGAKTAQAVSPSELDLRESLSVVDEEVSKLSDNYRTPFVLCYLEGRCVAEAAHLMGLKQGAVAVRLSRARGQLRQRLARRGVTLTAALTVVALARNTTTASPPAVLRSAVQAAASTAGVRAATAGVPTTTVVTLLQGMVKTMFAIAVKPGLVLLLALSVFGAGGILFLRQVQSADPALVTSEDGPKATPASVALAKAEEDSGPAANETQVPDRVAEELRAMRGTWTTTVTDRRFINGEPQPVEQVTVTFVIEADKLFILGKDGFVDHEMTIKLDPGQKPRAIDLVSRQDGTLIGIYQLDGDTLRINVDSPQRKRPAVFPGDDKLMWGVLHRTSRTPTPTIPRYANAPGWYWTVEPIVLGTSMSTCGIVVLTERARDGSMLVTVANAFSGSPATKHRPVFLDANKNRYYGRTDGGGSSGRADGLGVTLTRWRMDPKMLSEEKISRVGVETLAPEARPVAARAALEGLRKDEIEVLPCPEIGKIFNFTLTTLEGKKLRSADLRGKVVLIDCWETHCAPCLTGVAELKGLYERSHEDGLEVIGISFDRDAAKLRKAIDKYGLPWPQVIVPPDRETQRLWQEVSGIDSVPRVFLIDRQGVLRGDGSQNLKEEIDKLLHPTSGNSK
jgi:RNA polymerase sigma factor (sigma-70 family)